MTERDRRISGQLVRLVQIVFGLVLAQSLLIHRDVVTNPFSGENWLPALALATVYITTVLSWIDWHVTMELRPYNFNRRNRHRLAEQVRLSSDMIVVIFYAYLLFSIEEFKKAPDMRIGKYLLGFAFVFGAYLSSGLARRRAHGKLASNPWPIGLFGLLYLILFIDYRIAYTALAPRLKESLQWVNASGISLALALMIVYRFARRGPVTRRTESKSSGLVVAIDIDGVLADQIHGIVPRVRARLGIELRYENVTQWHLPLGESDIGKEIATALDDEEYVINMPVHDGAREVIDELYGANQIIMLTARPPHTRSWTYQWLQNHGFTFDQLVNVKEQTKSFYRSDVLIDDYIANIREYLTNTAGTAILVDQPWNREGRGELRNWIEQKRLHIVTSIREATPIVKEIRRWLLVQQRPKGNLS